MPLKTRYIAFLGAAVGLAALGAAQSETVVRLGAPEQVTVTRLPGTVSGLAGEIMTMAAPASAPAAPVAIVAAPAAPAADTAPSAKALAGITSAAPLRSMRPDPRPEMQSNDLVIFQASAPVVHAAAAGCNPLAAMPDQLVAAAFGGAAHLLSGAGCPR